jgi:hypothetical protein
MKSYEESIQFTVDNLGVPGSTDDLLRYVGWTAYILLGGIYNISEEKVASDIATEVSKREAADRVARKQASRDANEARRLANLAAKNQ